MPSPPPLRLVFTSTKPSALTAKDTPPDPIELHVRALRHLRRLNPKGADAIMHVTAALLVASAKPAARA